MAKAKKPAATPKPAKRRPGRPSSYTPELLEEICSRLATGEPLAVICRDEGMPHPSTVRHWGDKDEAVSLALARAREEGEDAIAAGCLEIADDARNDWMEAHDKDGNAIGYKLNGEHVQRSKLRIETRLKLLACWNPKKYAARTETNVTGNVNVSVSTGVPDGE